MKVCILEDQDGYILHHHVMEKQIDSQLAGPMVIAAKRKFGALSRCSFDKGFHNPDNPKKLPVLITQVVRPHKGLRSATVQEIENSASFIQARQ